MKRLLVVAHPLSDSQCGQLARDAEDALVKAGHEVRINDLYATGFNPALTKAERASYCASFRRSQLEGEIAELHWAEALALIVPTWWLGCPAILKGWFDRVWAPRVAYHHGADLGRIGPRLTALRRVIRLPADQAFEPYSDRRKIPSRSGMVRRARFRYLKGSSANRIMPTAAQADRWLRSRTFAKSLISRNKICESQRTQSTDPLNNPTHQRLGPLV
ncbi:MAG: flavodoxin family protein [Methylacidiphilales bacterium]|nr:flavodoxin family protein [Candidatus Methylacidiphilales bacterium]